MFQVRDPDQPSTNERARLLAWYDAARRDLPWRTPAGEPPDPYRVWLSEVMLQQTRVETVRPYYQRWIERFPTLHALAEAPLDEVLKMWEGLGYYSRARNFHRAVREVAARFEGVVPCEPSTFRALPGVGRYTAGAVLSIAFGLPEPLVDGNVRRVFARLRDEPEPREAAVWEWGAALVPGERPGDLNQALMELGATICTPRRPRCDACPLAHACAARAAGTQALRPTPKRARPLPHEPTAVPVIERDGALLLVRNPGDARLGGLWSFPTGVRHPGETVPAAAERAAREGLGLTVRAGAEIGRVAHAFTHVRATYHAIRCVLADAAAEPRALRYDDYAWVHPDEAEHYALPVAQRKLLALVAAEPALF